MKKSNLLILVAILTLALGQALFLGCLAYFNFQGVAKKAELGVTFSPWQAYYLGLNPKDVLRASLNDLGIKNYRLSVYWNKIEPKRGQFDFSEIDWQLDEVEKAGGSVLLAIGRRLPRWPECHDPAWIKGMAEKEVQKLILERLKIIVNRYKNRAVVKAWQVENEPLLSVFGECPAPDIEFTKKEVEFVRSLDSRPIVLTASGELSTWTNEAILADKVGISIYRTTWDKYMGLFYYPLTPSYYSARAKTLKPFVKKVFVSELQAEPWERNPLPETSIIEQKEFMNREKLGDSVKFAKHAGFDEIYLWGVEWWYWLYNTQNDNEMWQAVRDLVAENK